MIVWLNRFLFRFWWNRIELKISKLANRNNMKLIVDISIDSHVDLIVSIEKYELTTNFFACCSRLCWRNIFLKLNVCLQCRHVVDFFAISHVDLIVSIKKNELSIEKFWTSNFWRFWTKFRNTYDENEMNKHCIDVFFIDLNTISNVKIEKFERFNKMTVLNAIANEKKIHTKRLTFFRFHILNWLHWSKNENFRQISKFHVCEYVHIIYCWNWNFVCKVCKSFQRFVDLMHFQLILIQHRMHIIKNSNILMKHVAKMFLQKKTFLLKLYWNVSTM